MKSVVILRKAIRMVDLFTGAELLHEIHHNAVFMPSIELNAGNEPKLWTDDKHPLIFWFFVNMRTDYFMYKCDYKNKTYTLYEISFGSELGSRYGRIVHPLLHTTIINHSDNPVKYVCFMEWDVAKDKGKKGEVNEIRINYLSNFFESGEWTDTFKDLKLRRLNHDETFYKDFAKDLKNEDGVFELSRNYRNAFPGTEYIYDRTIHSVLYDNSVYVNDIKLTDERLVRDEEVRYYIDSKWLGSHPVYTDDEIGIMFLGTDLEEDKWKKYVAIAYSDTYFPIEDGKVIFPDTEDE